MRFRACPSSESPPLTTLTTETTELGIFPRSNKRPRPVSKYLRRSQSAISTYNTFGSWPWALAVSHQVGTLTLARMDNLHRNDQPSSLLQQSSIFLLPSELLCEIFSLLASRGPIHLCHALFVCKHWHNSILNDQKLWSTIILDQHFVDRFDLRASSRQFGKADAYIRACLERSAPFPLYITLNRFFETIDGHFPDREASHSIVHRLFKYGEPHHIL